MILNHVVEIVPVTNNSGLENISDIGMFDGVIRWATAYDSTYDNLNSSNKFLEKKWIGTLTKSVTATRSGNYASTGGGTLGFLPSSRLLKWLADYDISIYNGLVTIKESFDGGATYRVIRTGIVSQAQDQMEDGQIPFSDISRSTATTITKEIPDTGKFYPVSFGDLPNAKTVNVGESADIPLYIGNSGKVAVWESVTVDYPYNDDAIVILAQPYISGVDTSDVTDYIDSLYSQIGSIALKQNDSILPIKDMWITIPDGIFITLENGNAKTEGAGGIVVSDNVDDYCTIVAFGNTAYDDFFSGERVSNNLSNYDNGSFVDLPFSRDAEQITDKKVLIVDSDSAGWDIFTSECVAIDADGERDSGDLDNIGFSGEPSSVTDGNTLTGVSYFENTPSYYYKWYRMTATIEISPTSSPSGDTVMTLNCSGEVTTLNNFAVSLKYYCKVLDGFGNSYNIGDVNNPIDDIVLSKQQDNYYLNDCSDFTNTTSKRRFLYGWDSSDSGAPLSLKSGLEMEIDFGGLPDILFSTGFTVVVYLFEYQPQGLGSLRDFYLNLNQIQFLKKTEFKSTEIYTDVKGRKDQDNSALDTLQDVYRHCIKLQNHSNRIYNGSPVVAPVDGWGLGYPGISDWSTFYDDQDYINDGLDGCIFQITNKDDARTDKIKAEICRLLWSIGYTDKNGVERFKSMVDGLYNTDGVLITYGDLFERKTPSVLDRKYNDVFVETVVNSGFNTATGDELFVDKIGLSGNTELDNMAKVLFNSFGVINQVPSNLQNCKWFKSFEEAYSYAVNFYNWQGVYRSLDGLILAKERYTTKLKLPYEFAVNNNLDLATSIQLQIPNMTYWGSVKSNHSGIITSISEAVAEDIPYVNIDCQMLGNDLAGADREIWFETGDALEVAYEGGAPEIVKEGNYGSN